MFAVQYALVLTPIAGAIEARVSPDMRSSASYKLLPGRARAEHAAGRWAVLRMRAHVPRKPCAGMSEREPCEARTLLPGSSSPVSRRCCLCRARGAGWRAVCVSLGVRTALVVGSVVVALSVPRFAYVMAFTGGLLGLLACVVVPALCYLQIKRG